jgi:hypothetical protein
MFAPWRFSVCQPPLLASILPSSKSFSSNTYIKISLTSLFSTHTQKHRGVYLPFPESAGPRPNSSRGICPTVNSQSVKLELIRYLLSVHIDAHTCARNLLPFTCIRKTPRAEWLGSYYPCRRADIPFGLRELGLAFMARTTSPKSSTKRCCCNCKSGGEPPHSTWSALRHAARGVAGLGAYAPHAASRRTPCAVRSCL